ncbi:MAG: AbrB/MazE/SpoVT family DNA-binding domain-containing protein [Vicinamibacterales bacterium]
MRLTAKGQLTIPVDLRQEVGFDSETELELEVVDDYIRIKKAAFAGRGPDLIARLRGQATAGKRTDQILKLTRR